MSRSKKYNRPALNTADNASVFHVKDYCLVRLHLHGHALFSSLGRLLRTPMPSAMTVLVLAFTIAMAGSFYLFIENIQQITGSLESSKQISLFLKSQVGDAQALKLAVKVKGFANVQSVKYISPDTAMQEFKQYSGFGDALNALDKNPLPGVIQIMPNMEDPDQHDLAQLLGQLRELSEVDFAQMDMQWLERLQAILDIAKNAVTIVSLLLALSVILITGNTIRLELQNRKDEVIVSKLVGATHAFIRRPFLYSGFWYGLSAGVVAYCIITVLQLILAPSVEHLSGLYNSVFSMRYFSFVEVLLFLLSASLLGILGAWNVLLQHLQHMHPE